jgi:hypothetical protein
MANWLTRRLVIWKDAYWRLGAKIVSIAFAVLGVLLTLREFLPPEMQAKLQVFALLPTWTWQGWAIFALVILLALALEGTYRLPLR